MFHITSNIRLFAFDLDGTLYNGDNLIEGAVDLIRFLKKSYNVVFFTNNSTKTRKDIYNKLKCFGFNCNMNEIYTSSYSTAKYLVEAKVNNVFVIGSKGLRTEIINNGICIVDNHLAENLVVGLDFEFNYKKIEIAMSILANNGKFIVCNKDSFFPVGGNRNMPACGAMVGAIATAANKEPDFVVGKPNTYILLKIEKAYRTEHHEIVVVGDSYQSDVMMAKKNKSKAILVNSKNDYIEDNVLQIENPTKILQYLKEC